jgi:ADP-ribose pyrophosphatase YjhB (NUDIX family)/ubiquinone/menaquinone biosynthesis C-methylase UbiE
VPVDRRTLLPGQDRPSSGHVEGVVRAAADALDRVGPVAISPHIRRLREMVGNELLLLPSAAVIPRDERGRILLVRVIDTGRWAVIGGSMEPDESPQDCARREAEEEAGVTVGLGAILAVLGGPEYRMVYPNGDETAYVSTVFEATVLSGTPRPDGDETSEVGWWEPDELPVGEMSAFTRALLRDVGVLPGGRPPPKAPVVEADGAIVRHYESIREEDRISAGLGQLELLRVQDVLGRHLPSPPAEVLDVGGATGVHAAWLAERGFRVRIVDIAERHVALANRQLGAIGVTAELGDARSLPVDADSKDVVLLFGPLYHLIDRADRLTALREAYRVVRPGGVVAVAAISRFASLFDGLARGFLFDDAFVPIVERDLAEGQHRNPDDRPHWFTTAFLHHPDELRAEIGESGLELTELVGIEGLAGWLPRLADHWDDPAGRDRILWSAQMVESDPATLGLSGHLLAVAVKP